MLIVSQNNRRYFVYPFTIISKIRSTVMVVNGFKDQLGLIVKSSTDALV